MGKQSLHATVSIGGAVASSFRTTIGSVTSGIGTIGKSIGEVARKQRDLAREMKDLERIGDAASLARLSVARQENALLDQRMAKLRNIAGLTRKANDASAHRADLGGTVRQGAGQMVGLGTAVFGTLMQRGKQETAALDLAKNAEGARDAAGNLTPVYHQLVGEITAMGRSIPVATNELLEMAGSASRMGIASEHLVGFTRTSAAMANALKLPSQQLSEDMAKIAALYKVPIGSIGALGDAINYLDDRTTAKGGEIIDFMKRVGGSAGSVKIGATQMSAIGVTMIELGETADTAASATNALFQKLAGASTLSKPAQAALQGMGFTMEGLEKGMQRDALGTVQEVLKAINKLPTEKRIGVLGQFVGLEHSSKIAKLANDPAALQKNVDTATSDAAKGSVDREAQASWKTFENQLQLAKNAAVELSVAVGDVFSGMTGEGGVIGAVHKVTDFTKANREAIGTVVKVGGAVFGAKKAFDVVRWGIAGAKEANAILRRDYAKLVDQMPSVVGSLGRAWGAVTRVNFAMLANPVGLVVAGLALVGLAVRKYWEPLSAFVSGVGQGFAAAFDPVLTKLGPVGDLLRGVGDAVGGVWNWFMKLLEPVKSTPDELDKMRSAGVAVGEALAGAFEMALTPLTAVIGAARTAWGWVTQIAGALGNGGAISVSGADMAGVAVGGVVAKKPAAIAAPNIGATTKPAQPGAAQPAPALPAPAMAAAKGATITNNVAGSTFNITAAPGMDAKAIADEVERRQQRRAREQRGARLFDGAAA